MCDCIPAPTEKVRYRELHLHLHMLCIERYYVATRKFLVADIWLLGAPRKVWSNQIFEEFGGPQVLLQQ
jgi:hypothetical protein